MIEIKQLSKRYHHIDVLKEITITFPKSGIVGLIGLNGSGKTTLFKMLTHFIQSDTGTVEIDGETRNLPQQFISFIPDMTTFYPVKVKELGDIMNCMHPDFDMNKYHSLLCDFQISLKKSIKHLSKGQKACLNIALTLSRHVPYYILDEPFDSIDVVRRDLIIENIIKYLNTEEKLLILSSHEIDDIERMIDSFILLENGQLSELYSIDDIRDHYQQSLSQFIIERWEEKHEY